MIRTTEKPLRSSLILFLVSAMVLTSGIVGGVILAFRLPQITRENYQSANYQANELASRIDALMSTVEARAIVISEAAPLIGPKELQGMLDRFVRNDEAFDSLYIVNGHHQVSAAGIRPEKAQWREELIGSDFSANKLYQAARQTNKPLWSDKHISALAGNPTIGLAIPRGNQVVIAEIPMKHILNATRLSTGDPNLSTWILDRRGEVVVDTDGILGNGINNLLSLPIVDAAIKGSALPDTFRYRGRDYHPVVSRSEKLPWLFLAKMPAGLDNQHIRSTLFDMAVLFLSSIVISLVLAQIWAGRMVLPLRALMGRARSVAEGRTPGEWPRSNIAEYNQLSADLGGMAATLHERELKFLAIFNDPPVAMIVTDPLNKHIIIEVNDAWIEQFGYTREMVVNHQGSELGLWHAHDEVALFTPSEHGRFENHMHHHDGRDILCLVSSRLVYQTEKPLTITAMEDISEHRRMENELRQLAGDLERRVAQRTEALAQSNSELTETLDSLRMAQTELVRAEKLAALGELVAGVAHELNTPIGNSIMAISTLHDQAREFGERMQQGLKKSALEAYLKDVSLASDIASRNLARAAELVTSFKQVAVDQTSSQRRKFNLKSVVDEMLLTLRPTFKRTPYVVECHIREDMWLDSYPGPLGQALTNLITNALLHGFDDRDHGRIIITADQLEEERVLITVQDDGHGIAEGLQTKIFTPFFTTKMGRGGTGLGLHIVHNTVTQILGGSVNLTSTSGEGTTFTLRIPQKAPKLTEV